MLIITEKDGHVAIRVKVQPGAPRSETAGEMDGMLKLKIAARPVDGKANDECCRFLATLLGVSPGAVEIKTGTASRIKTITVRGITAEYAERRLAPRDQRTG